MRLCLALLAGAFFLAACGNPAGPQNDTAAQPAETKSDPPEEKADGPATPPEKTPEEIEAERQARWEKKVADLRARAEDPDRPGIERWHALKQLGALEPYPPVTLDLAVAMLRDATGEPPAEGPELGFASLNVILEAEPEHRARAVDAVLEAATDPSKVGILRANLIAAVPTMAPPEKGIPVLVGALKDEMNSIVAADGLVQYGKPSVAPLMDAVRTFETGGGRSMAMNALGRIGEPAAEAVPLLIEVLEKGADRDLGSAAEALGAIGPLARDALPALRQVAENGMFGAREAKEAIARIEG